MKGRKPISFSAESSKPAEDGGILAGRNGVGAMHPLDSPVNAQAPSEQLKLVAEGENKRPRFEEGFYELEAIRKKRLRQGKVQYLIKWRGWPESANTWEPHENLSSCPDVVTAFEKRSRAHSGKRSRRGRKRKLSATLTRTEMGQHHSAAAAKVTPQTKTRRRQYASAPAAKDTMGIETRNMPCHSSAAAKDNVPATKGIPLVAVPFQCLDDSSIENRVTNDVCRPKVSGSSRARNEHPLVTNGSSLEKSVADSEETQILGTCFPPGFSKSNIRKPVRSGRCASSAAAKDNVPATKGIPLVAVPISCLDDSSIENNVSNDVCRPKVSGSSRAWDEHPSISNGSSLKKSVADSEETQLGACFPPGFSKSNIGKPVRSGRCASSASAKDNVPATKGIPLMAVPIPCLDDSSIENNVSNDVCRPKVSGSSRARDEHPLVTNGSSLEKSVADSEETQILGTCFPPGFSKSNIGKPVRSGRCASSAAAKDNVPATKGIPLVAVPIPCLDDSSIENNVSNDVCRPKVSGSSRARDEHPLVTNGSSLEKSVADSEETQILGTCFPPGFSKSNIGKPVRSGRCASSAAAKDNVPATKGIPLVAVPIPCLDDSSIENNVSNDVCRTKVSGSSRARDEHPLITNGSSLKKSIADSEETQLGACFPPGFSKSNIGKPVRSGRCASSASAKDNVPATKGIPLVAVPIPCLDDSSIENNVSNDVCRPKVSGSSRARDEHPLITNGSSLKKSVADSEETQLGVCFPPGFSKSNIGKPVRSGRCARSAPRAIRKTVGSTRKFTGKSSAHTSDDAQDPIRTTCSNMTAFGKDGFENVTINEIMRALSCQASVSRGVLTFEAKRSDGKVVRVTNDFLKANNPFLLLNFYDTYFRNTPEAAGMLGSGNRY